MMESTERCGWRNRHGGGRCHNRTRHQLPGGGWACPVHLAAALFDLMPPEPPWDAGLVQDVADGGLWWVYQQQLADGLWYWVRAEAVGPCPAAELEDLPG